MALDTGLYSGRPSNVMTRSGDAHWADRIRCHRRSPQLDPFDKRAYEKLTRRAEAQDNIHFMPHNVCFTGARDLRARPSGSNS